MVEQAIQPGVLRLIMNRCFVCTIGDFGYAASRELLDYCLQQNVYTLHRDARWPAPLDQITKGDTILLKFMNMVVAWGVSEGEVEIKTDNFEDGWNRIVRVDVWRNKSSLNPLDGVHHYGIQGATKRGAGQFAVVKEVEQEWARMVLSRFANTKELPSDVAKDSHEVTCGQFSLTKLFEDHSLSVPNYQRGFCWRKRNVLALLESLRSVLTASNESEIHIGTVILKKTIAGFDIVDGQQRLLTLTLLLYALGVPNLPLLQSPLAGLGSDAFSARQHIWWAKTTIGDWLKAHPSADICFANRVQLCVVILPEIKSEDLAYSFFNAVNSSGKRLSDYDLLKAHHLRFIPEESTAGKMAERWDKTNSEKLNQTLHETLYRLRVWSRHGDPVVNAHEGRQLFAHFSAKASTITGVFYPPLSLSYNSTVRGGASFFHYAELHRNLLMQLAQTEAVSELKGSLGGHSGNVLMDCIQTLLFLFYYRFGQTYLTDALFCIADVVSVLRNKGQVRKAAISEPVFRELVWAIDTATEPGQFFDWCMAPERQYIPEMGGPTQKRYWAALEKLFSALVKQPATLALPEQCGRRIKLLAAMQFSYPRHGETQQ